MVNIGQNIVRSMVWSGLNLLLVPVDQREAGQHRTSQSPSSSGSSKEVVQNQRGVKYWKIWVNIST